MKGHFIATFPVTIGTKYNEILVLQQSTSTLVQDLDVSAFHHDGSWECCYNRTLQNLQNARFAPQNGSNSLEDLAKFTTCHEIPARARTAI